MVLEATMICIDNSEWMRNGDYRPSRFADQSDAVGIVCNLKMQANPESTVGVLAMAGTGPGVNVIVTPTDDVGKVLASMHGLEIGGEANLTVAIQVAQLALKNRQNKQQQQRIIVFIGSPVLDDKYALEAIGKRLKKNNIAIDVVDFGESGNEKPEKLEALVAAVSSGGNSHIIHVPPGEYLLSDAIISSPILAQGNESGFGSVASGASGFEFGVDPELALALQSIDQRQSSTSNDDTVMVEAESEPNLCTDDKRNLQKDEEDQLLQQANEMLIEYGNHRALHAADDELFDVDEVALVLQMSVQEEETGTQSDMSELFDNQPFAQSVTYALPGVDLNNLSNKDLQEWHELLIGTSEAKKQRKKQKKKQHKKQQKKRVG
ncbi:hypothetical protein SEVIR_9G293600v4 [Setaria viridis]|uniref:26S proteasome non-ATPase regulatory subunit 4 homolog n=1 Tax=Setaria viridis TaxID=4556 RepID=A0A4U6SZ82_SETVI|nr:26S proteasome non-ATPase regulatory subunit 4 homolog isoform X1 [Setaria viridis]TKV94419.1 hypothetical protein SEVIR_9G293600v2 [Setaria viridis]